MEYRKLGDSDLEISTIGLGTMTWGEQNSVADAHAQLSLALAHGVNFVDTAELYAIPPRAETYGRTEEYIGRWFAAGGRRDAIVLASKAAGPGNDWVRHIRGGPRLNRQHLEHALHGSLTRLRTDYLDLYQIHWPERHTNYFGKLGYQAEPERGVIPIEETLEVLDGFVRAGKVRHIGISNETPWGTMEYLRLARERGWPRIVSIQNPYSLLNRTFEIGLAEIAHREGVGLLAYSPLGFGVLSGKYLGGERPEGSRLALFRQYTRYSGEQAERATKAYVDIAYRYGLNPAQMALAYVCSRPFVVSALIGATNLAQLEENLGANALRLSAAVTDAIEAVHQRLPNPAP
ncbi:MAG: NADP(H)-dependent aldo-keto reductase [Thiotrichales bacterium]